MLLAVNHRVGRSLKTSLLSLKVYPNIVENYTNSNWLLERAILAVRNEVVDDIILKILNKIPGEETIY